MKDCLKLMNNSCNNFLIERLTNTSSGYHTGGRTSLKGPFESRSMSPVFAEHQIKVRCDSPSKWMAALALLLMRFSVEWGSEGRKTNVSLS